MNIKKRNNKFITIHEMIIEYWISFYPQQLSYLLAITLPLGIANFR